MKQVLERAVQRLAEFNSRLCVGLAYTIGGILGVISVVLFYSVVRRYAFNNPVTWTEDLANFLMVWMVLLGAPGGLRAGSHVAIDALIERIPPRFRGFLHAGIALIVMYVAYMIIRHGWAFSIQGMRRIVPSMEWLPFGFAYMALPVGYVLLVFILVEQFLDSILLILSPDRQGAK